MRELEFLRVVYDESNVCPYLPEQTARMPLCVPTEQVTGERLDQLLDAGYRRSGAFFYRTQCPRCNACEPLRLDALSYRMSRSQKRVFKRAREGLQLKVDYPKVDSRRVQLFNEHRKTRGLDHGNGAADPADYSSFLLNAPCDSAELSFWFEGELIAISIADIGKTSLSAVYSFFDPIASRFSPGTYAILSQVELAKQLERPLLYLGLYVEENRHLNYKANFRPHERRVNGSWHQFE